jgi:AcrR family transcriptional regulator
MFVDRSVPRISREYERFAFARDMKQHIAEEIQRCVDAGELPANTTPMVVMRLLTSGVLGVAVLRLTERLPAGENADDIASDVLDTILAGLRSGIPLKSRGVELECNGASSRN